MGLVGFLGFGESCLVLIGSLRSGVLHRHLLSFRGRGKARAVPLRRSAEQPDAFQGVDRYNPTAREHAEASETLPETKSQLREAS